MRQYIEEEKYNASKYMYNGWISNVKERVLKC